jgi:hypothetical protein
VLGQYRVYPDLLGKPFIETVGKDSILRMLLCFGYGPMDITDIRIGETPIENLIPASDRKVHYGWDDDDDLSIFRDEVDFNGTVRPDMPKDDPAPGELNVAELTTGAGPEEISLDIMFPGGLIAFKDNGKPSPVTVRFQIREREQGGTIWTLVGDPTHGVDYDTDTDTGVTKVSDGIFDIKLAERGTITRGFRWNVPAGSTAGVVHEVQVTRVSTTFTVDNEESVYSDAQITGIRTIRPHIASKIKNLAKIELRINASETGLSGVIDNISAICTSIAPKFDGLTQSWGPAKASSAAYNASMFPTRNAAWLFAQVLRGPANSRPVEDSRIDGPGIAAWAGNLEGTGDEPISGTLGVDRNLDAVVDYKTTTRKLLADIAGAGRAALNIVDGKYSVVQDIPTDQVIQHFSPRNSRNFSGSKSFRKRPHALRTHFVNPQPDSPTGAKSYQKDEMIVYDDGYSEFGNPAVALEFRGSTTPTSIIEGSTAGAAGAWTVPGGITQQLDGYQGYAMRHTVTSADPYFYNWTGNDLGVDTTGEKPPVYVRMRLRRVTNGDAPWVGDLFWGTGALSFAGSRRTSQTTEPDWTKGWVTVVWDMTTPDFGTWIGNADINKIRFDLVHGGTATPSAPGAVFDIESITIDDGTQAATEFGELSLWGVSDVDQAFRDARYHLASTKLRPELFTIEVDVEHLVCNRGDLVRVTTDVLGIGQGGARFTSVSNSGGSFISGELDEEFQFESDKSYAMRIRGELTAGGPSDLLVNIVNPVGDGFSSTVTAATAFDYSGSIAPKIGDLILFGERAIESIECLVQRVSPRNDLTAVIEMVEYNAAVYDPGPIPLHQSNISLPTSPTLLHPVEPVFVGDPVSDETAIAFSSAGSPEARIIVNVITPQNATGTYSPTTHYHIQFRGKIEGVAVTGWYNLPRVEAVGDTRITIQPVEEGEVYDIRVRSISDQTSTSSDWRYKNNHTVIGLSTPPPAPTSLSLWGTAIRWEYGVKPTDFAGFIVKHQGGDDATWATGIPITTNLITDNWIQINGRIQYGTTTIMVRAVDIAGNESATLSAVKLIRTPEQLDDIKTVTWTGDWGPAGFIPKTRFDCEIEAGTNHLVAQVETSDLMWSGGPSSTFWSATDTDIFWGLVIYKEMSYLGHVEVRDDFADVRAPTTWPVDDDFPCRQYVSQVETEGADYKLEYRPYMSYSSSTGYVYFPDADWAPWPGERTLEAPEYGVTVGGALVEQLLIRFTISGGKIQGKLKAAEFKVEGLRKFHRELVAVAGAGTTVDLTGKGFRKITSVSITPASTGATSQAGVTGQAYSLDANHQPDGAGTTYELTGPTIKLDKSEIAYAGDASVLIEGY